jgi:hypothetical protein
LAFASASRSRLAFLPYSLSVTSRSIGQPLADNALQGEIGACRIIYAEFDAIGIAEIKFCKIAMQMLFVAMLIDAFLKMEK